MSKGRALLYKRDSSARLRNPNKTLHIKSESGRIVDKSVAAPLFDDEEEDDLLKAVACITEPLSTATRIDAGGSCPQNKSPNMEEDVIQDFHYNDDEGDDDLMNAFNNIYEYYFKHNTKPLPTKRKCFTFSPVKQEVRPPSKTLKFQTAERIASLKSLPASSRPNRVTSSSRFLTSTPVLTSSRSSLPRPSSQSISSSRSSLSKAVITSVHTPTVPNSSSPSAMTLSSSYSPLPASSLLSISSSRSLLSSAHTPTVPNSSSPSAMTLSLAVSNIKSSLPTLTSMPKNVPTTNESSVAAPDNPVDTNVLPPKRFLNKEERKLKVTHEPKDSDRKSIAIAETFVTYIKLRRESRELSSLSAEELSEMLASFWAERRKEDGGIHYVSTLNSEFARLAAYLKRVIGLNPTTHPEFEEATPKRCP